MKEAEDRFLGPGDFLVMVVCPSNLLNPVPGNEPTAEIEHRQDLQQLPLLLDVLHEAVLVVRYHVEDVAEYL